MSEQALTELRDGEARRLGRTEFAVPVVLEAGAGTGKTAVLVARMVHWCLGPGWSLHESRSSNLDLESLAQNVASGVVAITFTDAAAVEMQVRVAQALRGVVRGEAPPWLGAEDFTIDAASLKARATALASNVDRMRVQTIHGFCSTILREHALTAGLHPNFVVDAEDRVIRQLATDLVGQKFDELYGQEGDGDAITLAAAGIGPMAVADNLRQLLLGARDASELPDDPFSPERWAAWLKCVLPALTEARDLLANAAVELQTAGVRKDWAKGVVEGAEAAALCVHAFEELDDLDQLPKLTSATGVVTRFLSKKVVGWAAGDFSGTEAKGFLGTEPQLTAALTVVVPALRLLRDLEPQVLRAGVRLMGRLLKEARQSMLQQGAQSFDGLLRDTRRLLREHETVAVQVRRGIDQLLVDEFQDTDAGQCELVARLALHDLQGAPPKPGLFLVGDPKQSIYGWRSADLTAYESFVAQVRGQGGKVQSLTVNFRSVPPILDEVARCVSPVMEAVPGRQPAFEGLDPAPSAVGKAGFSALGRSAIEHWVSWAHEATDEKDKTGPETKADRARECEARAVAQDLVELQQAGELQWSDVALLMRSTTKLDVYLGALREAGVPYQVERDRNYYRRREVIDAAAIVRAVIEPHDQLALVAALRSPVVGVPDAAWLELWREDFPQRVASLRGPQQREELQQIMDAIERAATRVRDLAAPGMEAIPHWPAALRAAVATLAQLRESFRVDAADLFVDKLRWGFLQAETEAVRFLGAHRLANLERFYRRLAQALAADDGGPQAVLRALRGAVADELDESDSAPGDDSLNAVRVMTIHKAKGLTFEHVYLLDVSAGGGRGGQLPSCAFAEVEGRLEFCLFGMPTLGWSAVMQQQEEVSAAETVRLLYVALTRPQSRLVISGKRSLPQKARQESKPSLEDLLRERFTHAQNFHAAFSEKRGSDLRIHDAHDVPWRAPYLDDWKVVQSEERELAVDADLCLREASQLAEDAREAQEVQRRPRTRVASREHSHESVRLLDGDADEDWSLTLQPQTDAALARFVGTAVHRALELLDLDAEPVAELQRQLLQLPSAISGYVSNEHRSQVVAQARAILEAADRNGMLHELYERKDQILGREIPVLLPADEAGSVIVGTLDLLYRDPATGQLIVADFKTDQVETTAELNARAEHYAGQGAVYQRAVQAMFPDEDPPGFELWFLAANRIHRVSE